MHTDVAADFDRRPTRGSEDIAADSSRSAPRRPATERVECLYAVDTLSESQLSNEPLARPSTRRDAVAVKENLIEREEVVALLFNVSHIVQSLRRIELLLGEDDGEEEIDEG